ncbi:MAG: hypothetical protein KGL46_02100 [Hyphomicrobiales bacterium]|nr:hypothetical protein [Hyphomicrobiales bacterium]
MSAPGSFLWFAAHDLRLALRRIRAFFGKSSPLKIALILVAALAAFHGLGYGAARAVFEETGGDIRQIYPQVAMVFAFILPWIVSQALTNATRALYSRGDLDIILASPVSARTVFAARGFAIAMESIVSVAIFLLPVADMMAWRFGLNWLGVYPALFFSGLLGAALGLLLTMALFRLFGPRRTRLVAQILATLIGAGFALGLQGANVAPAHLRAMIAARLGVAHDGGAFDIDGPWWIPVRAAAGDPTALAIFAFIALALFALVCFTMADLFAHGAISTVGASGADARPARSQRAFRGGAGASLRRKEWRLITRDPYLASQILLQVVYTMPVSVVLWRAQGPNGSVALAIAPAMVVVAAHISASLAWLTISSEDAPDFLATAPVTRGAIERAKLEAIVGPLALLFSVPLFLLWLAAARGAYMTLFFASCAALSAALVNLWQPSPGKRGDLLRRHSQSKVVAMIEHLLSLLWAMGLALAAVWSWWALAPVALALLTLWLNRPKRAGAPFSLSAA